MKGGSKDPFSPLSTGSITAKIGGAIKAIIDRASCTNTAAIILLVKQSSQSEYLLLVNRHCRTSLQCGNGVTNHIPYEIIKK